MTHNTPRPITKINREERNSSDWNAMELVSSMTVIPVCSDGLAC